MADARALLRAQRTARRITHPHANYSSAGTLLCILCREAIKTESLWDAHVSSASHQKRLSDFQQKREQQQQRGKGESAKQDGEQPQQNTMEVVTSQKRKHDDNDEEMADPGTDMNGDTRRKRSRGDISVPDDKDDEKDVTKTPPTLPRRPSQTPSQGVELQIPSRPATPRDTPNVSSSSSTASAKVVPGPPIPQSKTGEKKAIDEDEWDAFEAEIAAASATYDDTTISAPAMTAEESARAKEEAEEDGDPRRKKSKPEVDLAEEKEEAQRALEEEFDEMRELQERVTQLKQRRESLRQRALSQNQAEGERAQLKEGLDKENGGAKGSAVAVVDEEESSSDDEDDDDWDSFRFRR